MTARPYSSLPSSFLLPLTRRAALSMPSQSPTDAGSPAPAFSSSSGARPAFYGSRSRSRSRQYGREHVFILPVVVPERKLVQVQRQVALRNMVKVAHDAALDQRPEAVDGASVDLAADVLARRVVHEVMGPLLADPPIGRKLIGRDQRHPIGDRLVHESAERLSVGRLDHLADHVSLAGDGADDRDLASRSAPTLPALHPAAHAPAVPVLRLPADVGFIDLDDARELLEGRVVHRGADAMAHVPGGTVGAHADVALHL